MPHLKIIGVEEHTWTAEIRDALRALPPERQDASLPLFNTGETDERLLDYGERRIREMDAMGMDLAVLSITTPATQILDPSTAVSLSQAANNRLAEAVKAHPDRFAAFATLPTPDPAAAVTELRRAVTDLGCRGAMIHGRTGDRMLDHPDFFPILKEAAALKVPLYIHPQIPAKPIRTAYYEGVPDDLDLMFASGVWGWHMETAINALRMIFNGVFEKLPELQIILGHWGEMIPLYLERVNAAASFSKSLARPPADTFREHFYAAPSGVWSWQMLQHTLNELGADRILFSIDYPFQHPLDGSARRFLEDAPISPADKEKIGHLNAERLLRLNA